jgi:hypothetical protein
MIAPHAGDRQLLDHASAWGQCGGKSWSNGQDSAMMACADGYACERQDEWYWQCKPAAKAPETGHVVSVWGQCGGRSLANGEDAAMMACSSGHSCVKQDEWYWQCKPTSQVDPGAGHESGGSEHVGSASGQCGGKSWHGGKDEAMVDCPAGYSCTRQDEWYWQCKPAASEHGSLPCIMAMHGLHA